MHELTLKHDPDVQLAIDLFLTNYNNPISSFNNGLNGCRSFFFPREKVQNVYNQYIRLYLCF